MEETRKDAAGGEGADTGGERVSWLRQAFAQLRIKLTLPYVFLVVVAAFAAAYAVTWLLARELDERFRDLLLGAGKTAADTVVVVEQDHLATWRPVAYTRGLAQAVMENDGDTVSVLASPLVINEYLDCLDVLDGEGVPVFSMHHNPGGGPADYSFGLGSGYDGWAVVQKVLAGEVDYRDGRPHDKYADLVETEWGRVLYTIGPIKHHGEVVGVLLVGTYLDNLVGQIDGASQAGVSVYGEGGQLLATTLPFPDDAQVPALDTGFLNDVLAGQGEWVQRREVEVGGQGYAQLYGAFEVRYGEDLGVLAVAKPLSFITDASSPMRTSMLVLFGLATAAVLLIGAVLAAMVVRRVRRLAAATQKVARGDLTAQVEPQGHDEVAALAVDFNRMVLQLQEGRMYRDLLGLTTSPEVADRLRECVEGGLVQLEAQHAVASVLFCDIRGFTRLSEAREPEYVICLLNEYLQGVVRIIQGHNGVVNKFVGDAALAFFGVLPESQPSGESAHDAVIASLMILSYLEGFNRERGERGELPLRIGVGVNTGPVVAGMVGSSERLEYTILGDTVNVAQRLSDLNKEYPEYDVFLSGDTCAGLEDALRGRAVHIGATRVKGRVGAVDTYAMAWRSMRA